MPALPAHEIDLPAAVAAVPALAEIEVTAAVGYEIVHCSAAGWLPDEDVRDKFNDAVPPGVVEAEDKARELD